MAGVYQNGNNLMSDTTSQDVKMFTSLVNSRSLNDTDGASNAQYSTLGEFSFTPSIPHEYCVGDGNQASYFNPTDCVYHQPRNFRLFESEDVASEGINYCTSLAPTTAPQSSSRLGGLFKTVTFHNPSTRLIHDHNSVSDQDSLQKSLTPLAFSPIYSNICLATPQRLPFDTVSHQFLAQRQGVSQLQHQQQIPTFPSPSRFRSQSGLVELLSNERQKSTHSTTPEKGAELKRLRRDECIADNSVPRSSYMCRKCRAHGQLIAVRQHKRNCPYKHCSCSVCSLVNYGRHIVARQIALYRDQKNHHSEENGTGSRSGNFESLVKSGTLECEDTQKPRGEEEGPHCRRCRNHGKTNPWKGHKKVCPFYYCICQQCILITLRKSNEKNLREVVQESNKELGLKMQRKRVSEEIDCGGPIFNNKSEKSSQEKQCEDRASISYSFRWNVSRDYDEGAKHPNVTISNGDARFLSNCNPMNGPQNYNFYSSRAKQAAAFAAAAAVAFQQEATNSSMDLTAQVKEESHIDCRSYLMGQTDYHQTDSWVFGDELKCTHSPKDVDGFTGQNGLGSFWQNPFQQSRNNDQIHADTAALTTSQ